MPQTEEPSSIRLSLPRQNSGIDTRLGVCEMRVRYVDVRGTKHCLDFIMIHGASACFVFAIRFFMSAAVHKIWFVSLLPMHNRIRYFRLLRLVVSFGFLLYTQCAV